MRYRLIPIDRDGSDDIRRNLGFSVRTPFELGTAIEITSSHSIWALSSSSICILRLRTAHLDGDDHRCLFGITKLPPLAYNFLIEIISQLPSYEFFLRTHQALAALAAYSTWRHLPSKKAFPRVYLYISAGVFLFMCIAQGYMIIRQNGVFRYRGARAHVTHEYDRPAQQVVRRRLC